MRKLVLVAVAASLSACVASFPKDPEAQEELFRQIEILADLPADAITPSKQKEIERVCAGLRLAALLGQVPPELPWEPVCERLAPPDLTQ